MIDKTTTHNTGNTKMLTLAIDTVQADAYLNHISIDCEDGVRLSDFDHDDQQLIMMLVQRVENAKDVFSQQSHVVAWSDGWSDMYRLRDENSNIECIYRVTEYAESITLRKVAPVSEWVKEWVDDVLAECATSILDVAKEDDVNVKIWIEHHFFPRTLTSQTDGWLCYENYEPIVFATYSAAARWVKRQMSWMLGNESYTICK